jgi:hypothetical protein
MNHTDQIKTLVKEADNARAWVEKFSKELAADPSNENARRLLAVSKDLYDERVRLLAKAGLAANEHLN